jgi:flagellum-specific peptidoglycan hydrolase FlgJ
MKPPTSGVTTPHHRHKYPPYVDAFVRMALPAATRVKARWGVPISVLIAQSAQETGWGGHVKNNAYFGIKGRAPDGSSVDFGTTEVINGKVIHKTDTFRSYTDFADSADDYGRFLSGNVRYRHAFVFKNDPDRFVQEIAKAGYATDPLYAKSVIGIIHAHEFSHYDK